jgi:hypothetical protein
MTDWLSLRTLAILVERFHKASEDPRTSVNGLTLLAAEIRQRETLLGATIMDRMRLRMRAAEAAKAGPVVIQGEIEEDDDLYRDLS